jgi:hypothetical protein
MQTSREASSRLKGGQWVCSSISVGISSNHGIFETLLVRSSRPGSNPRLDTQIEYIRFVGYCAAPHPNCTIPSQKMLIFFDYLHFEAA